MARIYVQRGGKMEEADRLELAKLLVKAGYAVWLGRERAGSSGSYVYFIEYTEGRYGSAPTS